MKTPHLTLTCLLGLGLAACGGGDEDAASNSSTTTVTVTAAPLVVSAATPATLAGTLTKDPASVEAGSSNAAMTTFAATNDHCRVGAYAMRNPASGQSYFVEVSFRKDTRTVGLLKFGADSGLATLASASGPLAAVAVDIGNRRVGFTNVVLTTGSTSVTLNGSLEFPTNVDPGNRAACG